VVAGGNRLGRRLPCGNCGAKLYAVYPNPESSRRSDDRPAMVARLGNTPDERVIKVKGLGIAHCPECGTNIRLFD